MIELLTKTCQSLFYTPKNPYSELGDTSPREDQLIDNLERLGITWNHLNEYLRRNEIDTAIFPGVLRSKNHGDLVNVIISDIFLLSNPPHRHVFSSDEKRDYIAEGVVSAIKGTPRKRYFSGNGI